MKDNTLKKIEKIKQTRELPEENKKRIIKSIVANSIICTAILVLILAFEVAASFLPKLAAKKMYQIYSIEFLIFALILLEVAYKKDSTKWAASGLEILSLAVFTLFSPYIFLGSKTKAIYIAMIFVTLYYILKIIRIYCIEKRRYLLAVSDIPEIIKKESQDEMAQEFKKKEKEPKKIKSKTRRRRK